LVRQPANPADEPSLKEQAYHHVKKMILEEEVPANGFLSERNLASKLGMSKTPVRLAIARLEHEGFVRVSPQQGIVVVALSFEEILDFIDFRLALETFVVRSLVGNLGKDQGRLLQENLNEHAKLIRKKGDQREAIVFADMGFHALLASLKNNRQISEALERQQAMLYRVAMRILARHPVRTEQSYLEHQRIVEAILTGKKAKAVSLIEGHILRIKTLLIGPSD
jgi:DNA-binding GntR family transcriptional regulator